MKLKLIVAVSISALLTCGVASAQDTRRPPANAVQMKSSFAPVVRTSAPAVVNVYSQRRTRAQGLTLQDLFYNGGVPRERVEQSLGSGAIVRADGIVVTNNHVVENMSEIRVVLADRREFPATVLLADPRSDLAVLKIDAKGERLPFLRIDAEEQVEVGDLVLAIGNPYGVGQTVTNGIVSALSRTDIGITDYSFFIQTDAAINPGNSGGPLVDMDGDLIGLNTAIFSRSGGSSGIGFAIPAQMVRQVVNSAMTGAQRVERPWLGAKTQPVTREMAASLGLQGAQGVLVARIYPGSSADRAGLREGDVVLAIDDQTVNDEGAINYRVGTRQAGDQLTLRIRRAGAERTLAVRLSVPPEAPADQRKLVGRNPFDGATVANLSPGLADQKGLDLFLEGVAVVELAQGVAAQRTGLRAGDIIVEVNGVAIDSSARLQQVITAATSRQWRVTVERAGRRMSVNLTI